MPAKDAKSLSIAYKRKGYFDLKREELLAEFQQSETHTKLLETIRSAVRASINENPELLLKNRGQLAALIEGALSRSQPSSAAAAAATAFAATKQPDDSSGKEMSLNAAGNPGAAGSVGDLFDEEVKSNTLGSQRLRREIAEVLEQLQAEP